MALERQYQDFWGVSYYEGPFAVREQTWFSDGLDYVYHDFASYHHVVLGTDYENWALVYGCDQYFGFWKGESATLLSRTEFLDGQYVKEAKSLLNSLEYDYIDLWVDPGISCGWEAAPTFDELMIEVMSREPLWSDYA